MDGTRNGVGKTFERIDDIAAYADLNRDILVDLGKIEVEVDDLGIFCVS